MKKIMVIIGILLLICILFLIAELENRPYENNYFEIIGISGNSYEEILSKKGNPLKTEMVGNCIYDHYEDLILIYNDVSRKYIVGAIVIGEQYKFGSKKIGVGSEKAVIEQVYSKQTKIKDMPQNKIGYIDGGIWVRFTLDNRGIVSEILITYDL